MSDITDTDESVDASPSSGMDRRSALKKVAVGGAIAWTAPTVLSSKASAAPGGFCTPKCFPGQSAPNVTGCTYCVEVRPGQFRQAAGLTFADGSGGFCPCGGTPTVSFDVNNLVFQSLGGGGPTGPVFVGFDDGNGYLVVFGNGVLGQGTYISIDGSLDVTTSCTDRDGDVITTKCAYIVQFTFQPDGGSCNQVAGAGCRSQVSSISNVQFTLAPAGCFTVCNGVPL